MQLICALVGFSVFLLLWLIAKKRIGLGDAKLSALLGFLLGLWGWALAVFLASLGGVIFVLLRYASGRKAVTESIAFAPFFIAGALLSYFFKPFLLALL